MNTIYADTAIFSGGCFWCVEHDFRTLNGVTDVASGYTGGTTVNPTYEEVSKGEGGHIESVQVTYNPQIINYEKLIDFYFHNIDPTRNDGQFCDSGPQYRPVIFVKNKDETKIVTDYIGKLKKEVKVEVRDAVPFYPAEEYHQNYSEKNPIRYKGYRWNCGRDKRLKELEKDFWQDDKKNQ